MEQLYLVEYASNWADEFDVSGHTVIDETKYQQLKKSLIKDPAFCVAVGSNEVIEYGPYSGKMASDDVDIKAISQEEYQTLKKLGKDQSGRYADAFIENIISAADGQPDAEGIYIENTANPDEEDLFFDDIQAAFEHCEKEYQFSGESWKLIKESSLFESLHEYLYQSEYDSSLS